MHYKSFLTVTSSDRHWDDDGRRRPAVSTWNDDDYVTPYIRWMDDYSTASTLSCCDWLKKKTLGRKAARQVQSPPQFDVSVDISEIID